MKRCTRCAVLPEPLAETGTLFLAPPHAHTNRAIGTFLETHQTEHDQPDSETISLTVRPGLPAELAGGLLALLSSAEMDDTKTVILDTGRTPSFRDLMQARTLTTLVAQVQGGWLMDVLREERVTTWFQPIVREADPSSIFAFECLLRGLNHDGPIINPKLMFDLARDADVLFHLDRIARLTTIRSSIAHNIDGPIFINFNPTSIYNPQSCLQSTIQAISESNVEPERIVFEVVESEEIADSGHLLSILNFYRDAGFKVALDDIGSGYSSLSSLARMRPDFIKLDQQLIRDVDSDSYKAGLAARLIDFAATEGIETVAEGVETEGEWRWLQENGASLAQGYYFARPSAEPAHEVARPTARRECGSSTSQDCRR